MRVRTSPAAVEARARHPAVAGSFYPSDPDALAALVDGLLATATPPTEAVAAIEHGLAGILVPHAGLVYSGPVAAMAWRLAGNVLSTNGAAPRAVGDTSAAAGPTTVVLLGTNHSAGWLDGVGVWDAGPWQSPLGDVEVDEVLAAGIVDLGPPYLVDRDAHRSEHSLEVQLPFLSTALPSARIVPLAVATGTGERAVRAGERLGEWLADRRARGSRIMLAISTDMAHYPSATLGERITEVLTPSILALDAADLARREAEVTRSGLPGVACGMCGIEPTIVGLAALRAMGVGYGARLTSATSADVGGPADRVVGYLAVAFAS